MKHITFIPMAVLELMMVIQIGNALSCLAVYYLYWWLRTSCILQYHDSGRNKYTGILIDGRIFDSFVGNGNILNAPDFRGNTEYSVVLAEQNLFVSLIG